MTWNGGIGERARLRELGVSIGRLPTGPNNAITDVPGVLVGHQTVIRDAPTVTRSGVTAIIPRDGFIHEDFAFAAYHVFNGVGEITGIPLIEEWGVLATPILLTNTNQVGMARDALAKYGSHKYGGFAYKLGVIAETYDGTLNDIDSFPLVEEDVFAAIDAARGGQVSEGNVGGGTGMTCYEFKGGIGTSSRIVEANKEAFTVGALVQANHGKRYQLRVDGVPVGQELGVDTVPAPSSQEVKTNGEGAVESSSIIVVIGTDAPLLPDQCKRLARRATVGLARTGGVGYNTSGDIFIAFSTGNHYPHRTNEMVHLKMLHQSELDPFFDAAAEAVEESILNALTAAETMTGHEGNTAHAVPISGLVDILKQYGRL